MISVPDILQPKHVLFDPPARTQSAILHTLTYALREDPRIRNWDLFCKNLKTEGSTSVLTTDCGCGIFIPHTRTEHVSEIVMAAAKMKSGMIFEELAVPVHYVFLFAVPLQHANEYLRIIRSVLSIFSRPDGEPALRDAKSALEFIRILSGEDVRNSSRDKPATLPESA